MTLEKLSDELTVCRRPCINEMDWTAGFYFLGKTDREVSLVCRTADVPERASEREDGWRGFRVAGQLDFSLIGILSEISGILAKNKISMFAVSTYDTDYVLVKTLDFERALDALERAGHAVTET